MKRRIVKYRVFQTIRRTQTFITQNVALIFLIGLVIVGAFLGNRIFNSFTVGQRSVLTDWLYAPVTPRDFSSAVKAVVTSGFTHAVFLILLFLFGMTAFGCPLILFALFVYGFRIGVIEGFSFISNGWIWTVVHVHIPILIASCAILPAVKYSLRMSCIFSRQLLPYSAHCGGMWMEFKCYMLRYSICFCAIAASAITDVLLHVLVP